AARRPAANRSTGARKAAPARTATSARPQTAKPKPTKRPASTARPVPETASAPEARSTPSTLTYESRAAAARTGWDETLAALAEHTETGPELTGGDIDASWEDAYSVGDNAPGGDNPTPDQDIVEQIGRSLGVTYEDREELKGAAKSEERDRHRW